MDWRKGAACKGANPEVFFPPKGGFQQAKVAKNMCKTCPVAQDCLEYALEQDIWDGIYGGLAPKDRRVYVQRLKKAS